MMKSSLLHCRRSSLNFKFIRALVPFVAAFAVSVALAASAQNGPAKDDHPTLPPGEGRDVMIRVCSQCHQPENVVGQELDESRMEGRRGPDGGERRGRNRGGVEADRAGLGEGISAGEIANVRSGLRPDATHTDPTPFHSGAATNR